MNTRLRLIAPPAYAGAGQNTYSKGLFWWCALAVLLQLVFSSNVLDNMGLGAAAKLHPGTVILILSTAYALANGLIPVSQRLRSSPMLMLYVCGIPALMIYAILFVGLSGASVFIETFWSAGLLALLLEPANAKHKRWLGYMLLTIVVVNALIGISESLTMKELFPLTIDENAAQYKDQVGADEFRAHAFFSHPLTASLNTAMTFFLLYTMRLRYVVTGPLFMILMVALLAYGGRTALGVVVFVSIGLTGYLLLKGILQRNLQPRFLMLVGGAAVIVPLAMAVLVSQTSIGDRIIENLYYDSSAQVRATQWNVFQHLNMQDWLFGMSKERLDILKVQIGLGAKDTDIENFWILLFLELGIFGFTVFVTIFIGFLYHLGRRSGSLNGWLLVGSSLIIDSSSNSLGVWTNDLMLEVAFVIAIAGFTDYAPVRQLRKPVLRPSMPSRLSKAHGGLALVPVPRPRGGLQNGIVPRRISNHLTT